MATGEGAAGSHVRQERGFCRPHIRGVAYLFGQEPEVLVAGDHLENLFHGDFAEGEKGGGGDNSSFFIPDGGDGWHEIGHSVVVWHIVLL